MALNGAILPGSVLNPIPARGTILLPPGIQFQPPHAQTAQFQKLEYGDAET